MVHIGTVKAISQGYVMLLVPPTGENVINAKHVVFIAQDDQEYWTLLSRFSSELETEAIHGK